MIPTAPAALPESQYGRGAFPSMAGVFSPSMAGASGRGIPYFLVFQYSFRCFSFPSMDRMCVMKRNRRKGMRLTGWANAHMVRAALRFCRKYMNRLS